VECDLLFIDTWHRASVLSAELERWAPHCRGRIVIHCTQTYGEAGDDGTPGVLPALRQFVRQNPHWSVIDHFENNHGLVVLSCRNEDKPELPSKARQVLNFTKAMLKFTMSGLPVLDEAQVEGRLDRCALCKARVDETCSKCGCPLIEGKAGVPGKAFVPTERCPYEKWPEVRPQ